MRSWGRARRQRALSASIGEFGDSFKEGVHHVTVEAISAPPSVVVWGFIDSYWAVYTDVRESPRPLAEQLPNTVNVYLRLSNR